MKTYALAKAPSRLSWVAAGLDGREYLLDRFTVADAYLSAILNWSTVAPFDLKPWPVIGSYVKRMQARPAVARAMSEEKKLYAVELARHAVQ